MDIRRGGMRACGLYIRVHMVYHVLIPTEYDTMYICTVHIRSYKSMFPVLQRTGNFSTLQGYTLMW